MDLKLCTHCNAEVKGRADKKFCNSHCRSAFQYSKNIKDQPFYEHVRKKLNKNRLILKQYNKSELSTTRKENLIAQGFDPRFTTHSWKNRKGDEYKFVYEYGFLEKPTPYGIKFVLIVWQAYMS